MTAYECPAGRLKDVNCDLARQFSTDYPHRPSYVQRLYSNSIDGVDIARPLMDDHWSIPALDNLI